MTDPLRPADTRNSASILKPSLSKPSTLGTEYRTGLAPTSILGPYSASNPRLGIGHVDEPPAADATHLLLLPVKSPPAANHSDGHYCPFTGDAHGTLPLTVQGLGPRGVNLLGHSPTELCIGVSTTDTTPVSPSFLGASLLQVIDGRATGHPLPDNLTTLGVAVGGIFGINNLVLEGGLMWMTDPLRPADTRNSASILKPSLSKPSTLGTEYRTGLAPTFIPGSYSASNPGLGIGHDDDPLAADATHLLLSLVKSPRAANHSDGHCCPFTGDAHGTLLLTVQGLGPRGVHLLGQ
ncbi:hypothetical protein TIFTF001_015508 [Ficus carica]|uniref:Uncharacterized protein n=1 Tax=Ficus carica TaxID=3494 RepID=A0AA88A4L7_FICCA|nr:hypothetical protein TIFTF001_015508 [Ficus carica]